MTSLAVLHDAAAKFHLDGFVIIRKVFSGEEVKAILKEVERVATERGSLLPPGRIYYEDDVGRNLKALHRPELESSWLKRLQYDRRLVAIVKAVFPEADVVPTDTAFFAKLAGAGSETPPHQDNIFLHYNPPLSLTATVALDASDEQNGPLICRRHSHRLGLLPHVSSNVLGFSQVLIQPPSVQDYPEALLMMEPGDVSLHHANTVHYSHCNRSSRHRRQYGIGYRSTLAVRDEVRYQMYLQELDRLHGHSSQVRGG